MKGQLKFQKRKLRQGGRSVSRKATKGRGVNPKNFSAKARGQKLFLQCRRRGTREARTPHSVLKGRRKPSERGQGEREEAWACHLYKMMGRERNSQHIAQEGKEETKGLGLFNSEDGA